MNQPLRIALIADTFPPLRTSGAVQLRDLAREFARQGHELTVMLPSSDLAIAWQLEEMDGFQVMRLKAPKVKDISYVRRTIAEFLMPFAMRRHLQKSPLANRKWHGVVWYAPSIFHGPLASALKKNSDCKGYLIIRDIFPEWAVDMGLMGRGLTYRFFNAIAQYQYSVADVIGVQTSGNCNYFARWQRPPARRLEVLQNWLGSPSSKRCSIRIADTIFAGRKVFVYAGNMGIAQGMDILLSLAEKFTARADVGFLFVGRGSDAQRLKKQAGDKKLTNVLFFDEIDPDEIPNLYAQCSAGILALDPRHKSHNIPGKFLTYMQSGLPVLAYVNLGNDIAGLIRKYQVGQVCEGGGLSELIDLTMTLLNQINQDDDIQSRCECLFKSEFSVEKAVVQIVSALR